MSSHRIVLDGSTTWPDEDAIRQRLHCTGCDLAGTIHIRPAAQLDALVAMLRDQHEGTLAADWAWDTNGEAS